MNEYTRVGNEDCSPDPNGNLLNHGTRRLGWEVPDRLRFASVSGGTAAGF